MKPGTNYQTRLYNIIQNLKELNPDVIGLQEINETIGSGGADNMAANIADSLSAYFDFEYNSYRTITHLGWDQFYESIGIISKYPVEKVGSKQLANGIFTRRVVWNYINTPFGKINLFNTHMSHRPEHDNIRLLQIKQIMEYIKKTEIVDPGVGSILTGDLNCTPGSGPISLLTNTETDTFYVDTFYAIHPTSNGYTFSANSPFKRIDYVCYKNTGHLNIDTSMVILNRPYDGTNYCSDHLGVMTIFSSDATGIEKQCSKNRPEDYKLYQNYPNPFNPGTIISFKFPKPSFANLSIYDINGRLVEVLVNELKNAGDYSVEWNAAKVSSGVYFYRIKAKEFNSVKKCLIVK